jgi:glyoxylase-like metal-dependent hydrolase (beta-lactamase superfamily II)
LEWAKEAWPEFDDSTFDSRIWDPEKRQVPVEEIAPPSDAPGDWQQVGPFRNCKDFFGDGSFWIVDAPGHCPGNIAALVRAKSKSGRTKWLFLGGDCFHCHHFVHHPEAPFGRGVQVTANDTLHEDADEARQIIRQAADLKKGEGEDALIWVTHVDMLEGVWDMQ